MQQTRILIFAKAPQPGRVKTRLAAAIGEHAAAALYQRLILHSVACARAAALGAVTLWVAPTTNEPFFAALATRYGLKLHLQQGADIGERMAHAFDYALHDATPALLIGSDCAALAPPYLRAAATLLADGSDAVLGPAEDGGYFLIGMRRACPALFAGISWSTATVAQQTRARLQAAGLRWQELPPIWDVDEPGDLARLEALPGFENWRHFSAADAIMQSQ